MSGKVAIHNRKNSFSQQWIKYCENNSIEYKIVDCYSDSIISDLSGCGFLLWHYSHAEVARSLFARDLLESVEKMGISVFPDRNTTQGFDDKIAQKYLFEAIEADCMPSHVFFSKTGATKWVDSSNYPLVFKLRKGAGAENVLLVRNKEDAKSLIDQAFGRGFQSHRAKYIREERLRKFLAAPSIYLFSSFIKGCVTYFYIPKNLRDQFKLVEQNYVYFQDFSPGLDHDIRVIVIGQRAFGIKRYVRKGDFRASGSGNIDHSKEAIPVACIAYSFVMTQKLKSQCMTFDYVQFSGGYRLIEMGYGFSKDVYRRCPGFWDPRLTWHPGEFMAEDFIIDDLLQDSRGQ